MSLQDINKSEEELVLEWVYFGKHRQKYGGLGKVHRFLLWICLFPFTFALTLGFIIGLIDGILSKGWIK